MPMVSYYHGIMMSICSKSHLLRPLSAFAGSGSWSTRRTLSCGFRGAHRREGTGGISYWGTFDPLNKVDRFGSGKTMENPMCLGVYPKGFVYILTTLAVPKLSNFRPISSVSAGRLWSPATWRLSIWKLRKERWWLPSPERQPLKFGC